MFFDSHAHLTSDHLFNDIEALLSRARLNKVEKIVNICTDIATLNRGLQVAQQYPWVYNAAATTPHDVAKEGEEVFSVMEQHAKSGALIAVGETGLDYHYTYSPPDIQKRFLRKYLHLALESQLPVIIHCREAFADFFEIIDAEYQLHGKHAPGVLHCFTGTVSEAYQVLERGWFVSLSGIVTFKKSDVLREVAKIVPLNQLLIETDSPFLAPQTHRGRTNEPSLIPEIAATIAQVKNLPIETIAEATSCNAHRFFRLKE